MKDKKERKYNRQSDSEQSRESLSDKSVSSRQKRQKKKTKHHSKKYEQRSDEQRRDRKRKHKDKKKDDKYKRQQRSRSRQKREVKKQQLIKTQNQRRGWSSSPQRKQEENEMKNQNNLIEGQPPKKQQPNFEPSGILLEYYNARQGISLKFHEPAQAHKPINEWRIYPFKENTNLNPIILKQSCYLVGKDERVCDILCQNPSISRQHAVIQFRSQYKMKIEGNYQIQVKPYIMDLQSTNGTILNDEKIQSSKYYELLDKDVLKFGLSDRQYVMFKVPYQVDQNE